MLPILVFCIFSASSLALENTIIVTDSSRIAQFSLATGSIRILVNASHTDSVGQNFVALAVDDDYHFFVSVTSSDPGKNRVFRIPYYEDWQTLPNDEDIETILFGRFVDGLEYDRESGKLFGSDTTSGVIFKMNTDGSGVEVLTTVAEGTTPRDVVIRDGYVYWNTWVTSSAFILTTLRGNIFRCPIDDCSSPERLSDPNIHMFNNGLDVNGNCVFWADAGIDEVGVINLQTGVSTQLMSHIDFHHVFSISFNEDALWFTDWEQQALTVCFGIHSSNAQCINVLTGFSRPHDFEFTSPAADSFTCLGHDDSSTVTLPSITSTETTPSTTSPVTLSTTTSIVTQPSITSTATLPSTTSTVALPSTTSTVALPPTPESNGSSDTFLRKKDEPLTDVVWLIVITIGSVLALLVMLFILGLFLCTFCRQSSLNESAYYDVPFGNVTKTGESNAGFESPDAVYVEPSAYHSFMETNYNPVYTPEAGDGYNQLHYN